MNYVTIAILGKPFGLQGEILVYLHTDFPELRFKKGRAYHLISPKGEEQIVHLSSLKDHGNKFVIKFKEFKTIEEVENFNGYELCLDKEDCPLPEGAYRFSDMIGSEVFDEDGNKLGVLVEVTDYAPTKNLKIKMENKKHFYVPFLDQFVPVVDTENKRIVIHVIEGMLP